ncbi:hypothetical protein [Amycolatopsis mediterranei]|uniref:Uncharacterized protein n=1 Tax=Amycolatopsis mediterranei (strain S699) TaxID=713604 RepID=A0A9R0P4M0_AMYMS|nr:hypothetical protein [Amycolatopsis mediterranei]AEK46287.1 hypothetical protein RAM_39100 [Amycolatopsis mediterranei S699]UZF74334.1 hypothetical protein ISP_007850 [Amycolatopsis mediterranei]
MTLFELRACYVVAEATALVACGHPVGRLVAIVDRDGRRVPARVFCALVTGDGRW